jgi:hypothetical protein
MVADDGRWISTQVRYRDETRKQHWKTFSGPDTLTIARQWKTRNVDAKSTTDRPNPRKTATTLGDVYDAQFAGRQ